VRLALRTQQVIAHESGVADSIDPLAGSYLVEYLTDEIERGANEYIEKIDSLGGALAAIEQGYIQDEIQSAAYQYQQAVERGEQIIVGVNAFQVDEKPDLERLKVDHTIESAQRRMLETLRQNRDAQKVNELLGQLDSAALGDQNLVPLLVECVEKDITLGEICGLLRQVWGEYVSPAWV
jgi:methylmalonyl-CoA mutase N-terminal domain/subunit